MWSMEVKADDMIPSYGKTLAIFLLIPTDHESNMLVKYYKDWTWYLL